MPKKTHDKETLKREYAEVCPKYKSLATNLKQALEEFLKDAGIEYLYTSYRIKDFNSFWDKTERKGYKKPLKDIEDICGLRIICYYPPDLWKISDIINKEFNVIESLDKTDLLEPDRFGYRALHFIVNIKKGWAKAPNYRGLDGLKAEIQVCTILMHAWADIEHKLAYKKEEHVPDQFKRKLYQLSALFEIADAQFDSLRKEKEGYKEHLITEDVKKTGRFDVSQEMNIDSLQAFLDFYFPDREKADTGGVLDEILISGVTLKDLVDGYEKVAEFIPEMEKEFYKIVKSKGRWHQTGIIRQILDITHEGYWKYRKKDHVAEEWIPDKEKWSAKLSKK